jgi:hypothetical protein
VGELVATCESSDTAMRQNVAVPLDFRPQLRMVRDSR